MTSDAVEGSNFRSLPARSSDLSHLLQVTFMHSASLVAISLQLYKHGYQAGADPDLPYSKFETIVLTLFGLRPCQWVVVASSTLIKTGEFGFQLARHEPVFGPEPVAISMVRAGAGCQNGYCNGLLRCQSYGQPPNSLAEYALNQYSNLDFFDVSLVDGFNVPIKFIPTSKWVQPWH
ncbi:hypothetical protein RND71_016698 [Anisodus tanguticus]|uniref:Uncharacterized protein n=1 Tax=Anisodus tanguticus TaxID=243964 RepID=A0AAE1S8C1_9SOLA|nr:hypothetical protein RND71_016698 [Anisodus tanguticus]